MAAARQAALSVGGMVAVPLFDANRPAKATDFNDLHQAQGLEAVKACIASAQAVTESDWPQPQPLPQSLPEVQPFDADLLPDALRAWVADVAFRMQQPPDFAAAGAIVALSSLVGVRAAIHPKQHDDWLVIPNLWGMLIGRPSAGKSPALNAVTGPLRRLEAHERTRWQEAYSDWELDCKVAGLVEQANEKQAAKVAAKDAAQARRLLEAAEKPEAPVMRRFVVNDSTVEKLGELLRDAPFGLLAYRDELYGLLASMDKQGNEESRAFYLQAYDGNQGFTFDRIIRGETHIPRVCLALLGGIQPARLQEYVRSAVSGGAGDDGLLQRFGVAVWPDMRGDFKLIDQWPDTPARQTANDVFDRLSALEADGDDPKVYRFDSDAQRAFNEWYTAHMQELRSGELHPALESHLGKYPTLIPSLALLFALIDAPDCEAVGLVAFMRAQSWGEYLRSHAMRIYSAASRPDTGAAHALLNKVKQGKVPDGFRLKDVKQNGWAWLDTTEAVKRAVSILEDYGWIRGEVKPTTEKGGRPGESYALHPSLKKDYRL